MGIKRNPQRRFAARADLQIVAHSGSGDGRYTVKDPVALEYFLLRPREHFLLQELRSPKTIEELCEAFRRRHPQEKITADEALAFCAAMQESSLLTPSGSGQAELWEERRRGRPRLGGLLSPLSIRFPGVDPTRVLLVFSWLGRLLFSRGCALALGFSALAVAVVVAQQVERLAAELTRLPQLADAEYLVPAVVALVLLKSWHELGHGLACQRFGGECREAGILLLVGVPCLYCDVSDSWAIPSRWRRAVIAGAGIYFEAILAVACLAIWAVIAPGFLSHLALYIAVMASVGSVLVNANPLLRFDGYYLLADAWGVPNLHQQSREALTGPLSRWIQGSRAAPPLLDASRLPLAAYAALSQCYVWFVLTVILWGVHRACQAAGFRFVGDLLIALTLGSLLLRGALATWRLVRSRRVVTSWLPALRLSFVGAVAAALAFFACGIELEQSLRAPCRLESTERSVVAAPSTGELIPRTDYGARLEAGDAIAQLVDHDLQQRWLALQSDLAAGRARLGHLRERAPSDPDLFREIRLLETRNAELRREAQIIEHQAGRMKVVAPRPGVVLRPPARRAKGGDASELSGWIGAPLDGANRGCSAASGDVLCVVAGDQLEAIVLLSEADSGLASLGDQVRLLLDREPGEPFYGRVTEIGLAAAPDPGSSAGGDPGAVVERSLRSSLDRQATYRVRVRLERAPSSASIGAIGQARIITGAERVDQYVLRLARQSFHFQ